MELQWKNRAYSLNTKPNKKLAPKLKKSPNPTKTRDSCSSCLLQHCLFKALLCPAWSSTQMSYPFSLSSGFYTSLKSFRYRQYVRNPDVFLFFQDRPRVFWPDGRSAQPLCVRQHSEHQTSRSAGAREPGLTARTFLQDLFQILIRSCTRPWEAMVNINSYFTEN